MPEFNIEDCDEVIATPGSSLAQMLALQLKNELKRITELEAENATQRTIIAGWEGRSAAGVARILNAKYADNKTAGSVCKMLIALNKLTTSKRQRPYARR